MKMFASMAAVHGRGSVSSSGPDRIAWWESHLVVGEASSYAELVSKLNELNPDVILMDVHMPGLNRIDSFRPRLSGSCVLAMSFWNNEETAELVARLVAVDLLDKTNLIPVKIPAIEGCAQRGRRTS
jgi:chemotaxis response regulator CheB